MKRIFFILIIISGFLMNLSAQTKTDYFINTSTTRSMLNPALRPSQGYIGIPALSNISLDVKTNRLNLDHLTFEKEGYSKVLNFMHKDVTVEEFLDRMADNNYLATDVNIRLLGAGWYSGKGFWSVDVGVRAHADLNIPKSTFEFLKKGFRADPHESYEYDLKNIGGNASGFVEMGTGYSRPFLDNSLTLGAKAKVLLGLGNFDFNIDKLNIRYSNSEWVVNPRASLYGSVGGLKAEFKEDGVFDSFDFDSFGISGFGLGFDLGGVYDFKNISQNINNEFLSEFMSRTKVSMAFTDIGFISWSGSSTVKLLSDEEPVVISPNQEWGNGGDSFDDYFDDVITDFEDMLNFKESEPGKGRSTSLRTNMNIGLEYEAWKNNLTVGLLSSTQFGNYHTTNEFTISANYNPNKSWFATSLSYSFIHSKFNTFGLAIHLAPSKGLNFFIASDYIIPHVNKEFIPVTSKSVNVQFGFTVPLGGRRF